MGIALRKIVKRKRYVNLEFKDTIITKGIGNEEIRRKEKWFFSAK